MPDSFWRLIAWKVYDTHAKRWFDWTRQYFSTLGAKADRCRLLALRIVTLFLVVVMCSGASFAYSVLTHEEIVDLLWSDEIRPLLLKRYPGLSEDQIKQAHAYAYGGAVIQDLGYYPFGSTEFSNLVHYVRSGDFVRELLLESQDANEYAFALGALSHYASDIAGHPAVNQSVAIAFPKLRAKFGQSVRYAQDKTAHLKTEFGFDTVQVAKNRYASEQYHDFIGFQVSKPLLERVFPVVYGVDLKDVLTHEDLAVGSYRFAVSELIPRMTQVALQTHKKELMRETPNFAKRKFLYRLSRSSYEKEWGKDYVKPGVGTRIFNPPAIHAEGRSLQRVSIQQPDPANRGPVYQEHQYNRRSIPGFSRRSARGRPHAS